jgi:hypothetical protein
LSAPHTTMAAPTRRRKFLQVLTGLVALPLSVGPFLAYGLFTPEGRILRDRLIVTVAPPKLPDLSPARLQDAAAMAPRYQGKVMPLVYHGVGSPSDAEGGVVVSPRRFGEQLATLLAAGMVTVTAQDAARASAGEQVLPDNAVTITFSDGQAEALLFADPLLEHAGMRATMFVSSSATDQENLSSAGSDSLEKAARSGRWDIVHYDDQEFVQLLESGQDRFGLPHIEVGNWSGPDLLARMRDAAGPTGTPAPAEPPDDGLTELELVAPPPPPEPTTTTTLTQPVQGGRPDGAKPAGKPSRPAKPSVTTTATAPPTTSTTNAPGTTTTTTPSTTSTSTTTTTRRPRPTTTTTTGPATTTTTRPSDPPTTTTTTTEDWDKRWKEFCRENPDHRYCQR